MASSLYGEFDRSPERIIDSIGLLVPKDPSPKKPPILGSRHSHSPLLTMDLREILWDFHVVCLNAP